MDADRHGESELDGFLSTNLGWLADAPLFIDGDRIEGFYNAVVQPSYEQEGVKLQVTKKTSDRIKTNFGVTGELSLGSLGQLFAGLLPSAKVSAEARRESEGIQSEEEFNEIILRPIKTPSDPTGTADSPLSNQPTRAPFYTGRSLRSLEEV